MLTTLQSVILGLVEGVTEYLPVSSTGHLIITSGLLGLQKSPELTDAVDDFEIVIQSGAILAVVGLYWPRFVQMLRGLVGSDPRGRKLLINLFIAFLPAAVIGILVHSFIKKHLFSLWPVVGAFVVGGVFMIVVDRLVIAPQRRASRSTVVPGTLRGGAASGRADGLQNLSPLQSLFIGFMQVFSMWPGTSRSMMTICGGVIAGLSAEAAAEFSFLLGVPTLLGATVLGLYKNIKHAHAEHTGNLFQTLGVTSCIVGMLVAAVSAAIAVKWLVAFLNKHGLTGFGIYRILLALALIGLVNRGMVTVETDEPAPAKSAAVAPPTAGGTSATR